LLPLAMLAAGLWASTSEAQETVKPLDLGMLRDSEISVVQKRLYSMEKRVELGLHLGALPFDAYTIAPLARFNFTLHRTETIGFELSASGGYGFKNWAFRELESPEYSISPEAYRYLGNVGLAVEWSPAYAKLNWRGKRVLHHNHYFLFGGGLTVEAPVIDADEIGLAMGPGGLVGAGMRIFVGQQSSLRVEIRDDIFVQKRALTGTTKIKQNVALSVGISRFSKGR